MTTNWYLGQKINHHLAGDISFCTYVDGRYEPNEMHAVASTLRPGMCFVDVGANAGLFTLLAAAAVGPSGAVHAFEPSPRERAHLQSNIELNSLKNVHVYPVALGSAAQTASLSVSDREHPGQNTLGGFSYRETSQAYSIEVSVETLDQVVERESVNRIDLMKIDVEGSETAVIRGASAALRRFRPVIIAEANETALSQMGSNTNELLDLIRSQGYEVQPFETGSMNVICHPRK